MISFSSCPYGKKPLEFRIYKKLMSLFIDIEPAFFQYRININYIESAQIRKKILQFNTRFYRNIAIQSTNNNGFIAIYRRRQSLYLRICRFKSHFKSVYDCTNLDSFNDTFDEFVRTVFKFRIRYSIYSPGR